MINIVDRKGANYMLRGLLVFVGILPLLLLSCATTSSVDNMQQASVHLKLGLAYLDENNVQLAYVEFQKVLEFNPRDKEALNAIGVIYSERFKQYDDAIRSFKKALEIDPDYSDAYHNLGVTYANLKEWDKAIDAFKSALKNKFYKTPERSFNNLGFAYYEKGDYLKAIDSFKDAIRRSSGFPLPYYGIGLSYLKLDKTGEAIENLKKAITLDPNYIDARWELAMTLIKSDKEKAITEFKEIVKLSPDSEKGKEAKRYIQLLQ